MQGVVAHSDGLKICPQDARGDEYGPCLRRGKDCIGVVVVSHCAGKRIAGGFVSEAFAGTASKHAAGHCLTLFMLILCVRLSFDV